MGSAAGRLRFGIARFSSPILVACAAGVVVIFLLAASHGGGMEAMAIRADLERQSEYAARTGALRTLPTVSTVVLEQGISWVVSTMTSKSPKTPRAEFDPFDKDHLEVDLVVQRGPPGYVLVLNKFHTIRHHALLISSEFRPQSGPLLAADLSAWVSLLADSNSLGFYNSAFEAGASQGHLHLQLVPRSSLNELVGLSAGIASIPTEACILKALEGKAPGEISRVPAFKRFRHATAKFSGRSGTDLLATYRDLLKASSVEGSDSNDIAPHNAIVTETWMLVVPRRQDSFLGVDVNGLGFAGFLLASDLESVATIERVGPMSILQGVTFSWAD
jgi:ATP adenylyltransferase